ncbi:MAG TPA: hypothetical protein VFA35_10835 [Burkholderiaceae bacterium]|nr:hypothetical protein [Burkholderiaceae bacterium]
MRKTATPFPTLITDAPESWQWPAPPIAWRHRPAPGLDEVQPCRIESPNGTPVDGEMLGFDPGKRTLTFRSSATGPVVELSFARFRRLTLTEPLRPVVQAAGTPVEQVRAAAHERDYRLRSNSTAPAISGRTAGRVEAPEGLYLFAPVEEEASLQRVFVPRSAYTLCEFGASAEEVAARMWIASPTELLAAIERQQRMPIRPLGQSMLELGLLTQTQLERALARQTGDRPLGESLVAGGLISRNDLQTALAHKMGYPRVDLARFPIDPQAIAKLPQRIAVGFRLMPLMLDGDRLIVAVDKPARVVKLRTVHAIAGITVVPVLASRMQILAAQERETHDIWSGHVSERLGFFSTTV